MPIKINNKNIDTENIVINHRKIGAIIHKGQPIMCRHTRMNWVVEREATCEDGKCETGTCSCCGKTESKVGQALGHDLTYSLTEATCTSIGQEEYYCSRCDYVGGNSIPALGHSWVQQDSGVCYITYTCERCGEEYTESTHPSFEWVLISTPTCESNGYKSYQCTYCGEEQDYEVIPGGEAYHEKGWAGKCIYCGKALEETSLSFNFGVDYSRSSQFQHDVDNHDGYTSDMGSCFRGGQFSGTFKGFIEIEPVNQSEGLQHIEINSGDDSGYASYTGMIGEINSVYLTITEGNWHCLNCGDQGSGASQWSLDGETWFSMGESTYIASGGGSYIIYLD